MALCSPRLQRFLLNSSSNNNNNNNVAVVMTSGSKIELLKKKKKKINMMSNYNNNNNSSSRSSRLSSCRSRSRSSSSSSSSAAIAINNSPDSVSDSPAAGIRWGSAKLQGPRDEMEDDALIIPPPSTDLGGFLFAAVFDGHAGFSSVNFLREELYKECVNALQGGLLLMKKDTLAIKKALQEAFQNADAKLINWLEISGEDDESGATATTVFIGNDMLFISHVGDSSAVLSQSGKALELTNSHRPYGRNKVSLQEIKRIREAGGWISDGRICGDISVSRAFGDIRFKTKKNEMLDKGVAEGRWSKKFVSRIKFVGDLVIATPDIYQIALGSDAEFVLLATDGLWDYIKSSDAVKFVRNQLREHGDVQVASEALAQMALDQYSQDNVTIVIADLGRTDWQKLPIQQQNFVYELIQAFATIGIVSFGLWMSCTASL
uniref:probable protein phosphatase 2C 5 n=1 Tax=Erigeron canadensis TaxID=72917 RepID=UPI001CB9069D|nr:probable protein phosphatase 2C 5 [Erigeron canadensis]